MYSYNNHRERIYKSSSWLINVAGGVSVSVGVFLGIDRDEVAPGKWPPVIWLLDQLHIYALWIYVFLVIVILLGYLFKAFGTHRTWPKIQFILDEYQGKAFFESDGDPEDHHRVTLFKLKKNVVFKRHWSAKTKWKPWGNTPFKCDYLVPVARSGTSSKRSRAAFLIPDTSERVEGVAGRAWFEKGPVVIPDLPDVNASKAKRRDISNYAKATCSHVDMVDFYRERKRPLPRAIAAIPLKVKGERWGVVVLDSRRENGVRDESVLNYSLTLALLEQLLEDL